MSVHHLCYTSCGGAAAPAVAELERPRSEIQWLGLQAESGLGKEPVERGPVLNALEPVPDDEGS
jgi:hypothetical protein